MSIISCFPVAGSKALSSSDSPHFRFPGQICLFLSNSYGTQTMLCSSRYWTICLCDDRLWLGQPHPHMSGKTSPGGTIWIDWLLLSCLHRMLTTSCFLMSGSYSPLLRDHCYVRSLGKMFFCLSILFDNQALLCSGWCWTFCFWRIEEPHKTSAYFLIEESRVKTRTDAPNGMEVEGANDGRDISRSCATIRVVNDRVSLVHHRLSSSSRVMSCEGAQRNRWVGWVRLVSPQTRWDHMSHQLQTRTGRQVHESGTFAEQINVGKKSFFDLLHLSDTSVSFLQWVSFITHTPHVNENIG